MSLWLNSGVPATEVARRAAHGVAVLLKIYAHCIDGQADAANERIAEALGTGDAEEDPGDEGDGDTEQVVVTAPRRPPSVAFCRPRPWAGPCPSQDRTDPETRHPRTHSGRRQPEFPPRIAYVLVSGG